MVIMERDCLIEVSKSQGIFLEVKVALILLNKKGNSHMTLLRRFIVTSFTAIKLSILTLNPLTWRIW